MSVCVAYHAGGGDQERKACQHVPTIYTEHTIHNCTKKCACRHKGPTGFNRFWAPDSEIVYGTCNPNKANYAYNFTLSAKGQWDKCQQKSNNLLILFIPCSNYLFLTTPMSILFWQIPNLQQIPTQEKEHHIGCVSSPNQENLVSHDPFRLYLPRRPMALEDPESINTNTCQQLNDLVWTGFRVHFFQADLVLRTLQSH